jgi:hypothetical protein
MPKKRFTPEQIIAKLRQIAPVPGPILQEATGYAESLFGIAEVL